MWCTFILIHTIKTITKTNTLCAVKCEDICKSKQTFGYKPTELHTNKVQEQQQFFPGKNKDFQKVQHHNQSNLQAHEVVRTKQESSDRWFQ